MKSITVPYIILAFLILPVWGFGQKYYENGYIIKNNNDTLIGLVKDRKSPPFGKLYKKIRFKNNRIFKRKYAPHKIIGYRQGVNQFESLGIDESHVFFKERYTIIPNSKEKCFLKVIVKGHLTYYQWEFEDQGSDYISTRDLYRRKDENSLVRVTQGIFGLKKKRLAEYFKDCPELVYKIENKEIKDPVEIAIFYNKWKISNP